MTICPCCGFRFEGSLREGCEACGARSVGEALPKPEHELPSYARSLLLAVTGALMILAFLGQTIIALIQRTQRGVTSELARFSIISVDLSSVLAAGQAAAWRLKWIAIPVTIVVLWGTRKIHRSMLRSPSRFCGMRYARAGLIASALVPMMIAVLIGVTVPERLRRRQLGIEAGFRAQGYRIDRALLEYSARFGTLPTEVKDLSRLPDADGSIAAALENVDPNGYKTSADVAALPKPKSPVLRGAVIRNASINTATEDSTPEGLSFNKYELRLPGEDKLLKTEDDLIVHDGIITRASEVVPRPRSTTAATTTVRP